MAKHAKHSIENISPESTKGVSPARILDKDGRSVSSEVHKHRQRSKRTRILLVLLILVLVAALVGIGVYAAHTVKKSESASDSTTASETLDASSQDSGTESAKVNTIPDLTALLGLTQDEAIEQVGMGAYVASSVDVTEEVEVTDDSDDSKDSDSSDSKDSDSKTTKTETKVVGAHVVLTLGDEKADSKGGQPSVYLEIGEDGTITQAGYSTSLDNLGFSATSFVDAVNTQHVIESSVTEAGLMISAGTVTVPTDSSEYQTIDDDGTTVTQESYVFSGTATQNDVEYSWQSRLVYDYSSANVSGNLSDTNKTIYVYISK